MVADPQAEPRVTTIVRAYERRERTVRAVGSALAQTLTGQPVVVVDDGSTDGTAEAVEAAYGARVRVLRHAANRGPGAAANTGVAAVETPFVAFLDSDDLWHPRFLEAMVGALEAAPAAAVAYCHYRRHFEAADADLPSANAPPSMLYTHARCPAHNLSTVAARTRALRAVGPFRTDQRVGEDFDLLVRLWLRSPEALTTVDLTLVSYSMGRDNLTDDYGSYLAGVRAVCERYERHPALRAVADVWRTAQVRAAVNVVERRYLARWLAATPARSVSLVLVCPPGSDSTAAAASLASVAAQRLPPVDAVLVAEDAPARAAALSGSVPFPLTPVRPGQGWTTALAVTRGTLFAPLVAGDLWTADALDRYRRGASACRDRALFVYGGLPETPEPAALALAPSRCVQQLVALGAPGSLSAMAVLRSRIGELIQRGVTPPLPGTPTDWFRLAASLATLRGRSVRIRRAVVAEGHGVSPDPKAALGVLRDLAEGERGRWLAGLCDALADRLERGETPFPEAVEGVW